MSQDLSKLPKGLLYRDAVREFAPQWMRRDLHESYDSLRAFQVAEKNLLDFLLVGKEVAAVGRPGRRKAKRKLVPAKTWQSLRPADAEGDVFEDEGQKWYLVQFYRKHAVDAWFEQRDFERRLRSEQGLTLVEAVDHLASFEELHDLRRSRGATVYDFGVELTPVEEPESPKSAEGRRRLNELETRDKTLRDRLRQKLRDDVYRAFGYRGPSDDWERVLPDRVDGSKLCFKNSEVCTGNVRLVGVRVCERDYGLDAMLKASRSERASDLGTGKAEPSRREERKEETKAKYECWNDIATEVKKDEKLGRLRPKELAYEVYKIARTRGGYSRHQEVRGLNPGNIRRRLDEYHEGWSIYPPEEDPSDAV